MAWGDLKGTKQIREIINGPINNFNTRMKKIMEEHGSTEDREISVKLSKEAISELIIALRKNVDAIENGKYKLIWY